MTGANAQTITFSCDQCGRPFTVPSNFAGRKATCKTCGNKVIVPAQEPEPAHETIAATVEPVTVQIPQSENGEIPADATEATVSRRSPVAAPDPVPAEGGVEIPVVPARPRTTGGGGENAIPTSDPAQPNRRSPAIAMISEAQAPPVLGAMTPVALESREMPANPKTIEPASTQIADRPQSPVQSAPKVPVRIRRLMVDADQMAKAFSSDGPIRIKSTVGDPPELYQIEYEVKGMQRGWLGRPSTRNTHSVEIQLTSEYPRMSPKCKMLSPIFHPNIDETTICVGDHWTAGERLVDLTVRIGEMIAYQAYNIKSPLNGEAAMWADLNPKKLPVDSRNLHPGDDAS